MRISYNRTMRLEAGLDVATSPAEVMMKFQYSEPCNFSVARFAVKKPAAITVHIHALTCKQTKQVSGALLQ
jgi:hypothetical protein